MKKFLFVALVLTIAVNVISCKKEKDTSAEKAVLKSSYVVDTQNSNINWTAYKTTDKVPVKGVFNEVKVTKSNAAENPVEVLNGLEFEIPIESIYTKDTIRDYKLKQFFFGTMANTSHIKGIITMENDGNGAVDLTMNGLTKSFPYSYEVNGETIDLNATIELDNWHAQAAITALNEVCFDMHKGADGISKTWTDVAINVQIKTELQK